MSAGYTPNTRPTANENTTETITAETGTERSTVIPAFDEAVRFTISKARSFASINPAIMPITEPISDRITDSVMNWFFCV